MPANLKKESYRPEIDGLRAIAVISVIINHFNKDILPNGYLGVDIFFVISGFVITNSILGSKDKSLIDFLVGFYERRLKRLLPALIFYLISVSLIICLFNFNPEISLKTGFTSLFGLSNIFLYANSTDYFAQSTELNLFTHTWSLGVEEQFYFVFPFLIWFSMGNNRENKFTRNFFTLILFLSVCSFISFIFLYSKNQPAAYFMMSSRFWEISAGCLTLISLKKRGLIFYLLKRIPSFISFIFIIFTLFLKFNIPVFSTTIIVLCTSSLLISIKKNNLIYNLLTKKQLTFIGLISYSLYLWHWGILSISRWTVGIFWWSIPFQIALIFLMSFVSFRYIETPFRKKIFSKKIKTFFSASVLLSISSLILFILNGPFGKKLYLGKSYELYNKNNLYNEYCLNNIIGCQIFNNKNSNKNIAFIGDSHTQFLYPIVEKLQSTSSTIHYSTAGTYHQTYPKIFYKTKTGISTKEIKRKSLEIDTVEEYVLSKFKKGDKVLISNSLPRYFSNEYNQDFVFFNKSNENIPYSIAFSNWVQRVDSLAKNLYKKNILLFLIKPLPRFPSTYDYEACTKEWFRPFSNKGCLSSLNKSDFIDSDWVNINNNLDNLKKNNLNLDIIDLTEFFCDDEYCKNYDSNNNRLFKDDNHLSEEGIKLIEEFIIGKLR